MTVPLRICLLMQGGRGWTGGSEYIKNIILALGSIPPESGGAYKVSLHSGVSLEADFRGQVEPHLDEILISPPDRPGASLAKRLAARLRKQLIGQSDRKLNRLLVQRGFHFVYPYADQFAQTAPFRSAAWIYDFQHKHCPHFFTEAEIGGRDRAFQSAARYASTVVLSSNAAKRDFEEFFPWATSKAKVLQFHTFPNPSWVKPNPEVVQRSYCLPDRFFLVSNQFWKHKNHMLVLHALAQLRDMSIAPNVVFTGHLYDYRHPDYGDEILRSIHKMGVADQVFLLGLIPRGDQIQLMRRALAVVQPSLFEGWSTVVEDARCLGKRLAMSALPVHLEQDPPGGRFFAPDSVDELAQLLAEWWRGLVPGPELSAEAKAFQRGRDDAVAFGLKFLEIARGGLRENRATGCD